MGFLKFVNSFEANPDPSDGMEAPLERVAFLPGIDESSDAESSSQMAKELDEFAGPISTVLHFLSSNLGV
jgi:hypothetical protein